MNIFDIFDIVVGILIQVIYIAFAFIFVAFFWGMTLFIRNIGDEKTLEEGKKWMLWSVIALFVAISLWGILGFIQGSIGIGPVIIPPLQEY
ncbi:hypothetical protein L0Y69_00225 [bacterium]|nr:hypothetical protein [bacterium]